MVQLAIEARGLRRSFGAVRAVDDLDLAVPAGSVYGFLGPNGSGKTTTIRLLLGLLRPGAGSVRLLDRPLSRDPALYSRIGALVERPALYGGLSARDNLRVVAATAGMAPRETEASVARVLQLVDLEGAARRPVRGFSTGMRQRLAIGLALLRHPELVILDEPTAGLDPAGVVGVRDLVGRLTRDGATIFLSSHVLPEVEQLCNRMAVLHRGRLVAEGTTAELLGGGTRLYLRFATPEDCRLAGAVLGARGWPSEPLPAEGVDADGGAARDRANRFDDCGLLLPAPAVDGAEVNRALAEAGIFASELGRRRPSLEAVFLQLTGESQWGAR